MAKFVLTAQLQLQAPKNVGRVVNQIQQQLKGVTVDVEAKGTANAQRQIEKVRKETDKAAKSADRMGKAFAVSIRRFTALAIATRAVSLFSNSLGGAVKEAISFERELVKISQVTGKTMGDLRDLTDTITNLSRRFGVASSSLLNVSRILSQAGFDAKQTEIALSTLARTELAPTFDNITQTAEGAVAIFNQFRKGAAALETQLGAINAVAGKFAVEAGDLISVLRRAGGVFKASGGELNELIALFTSVRSTTRESADSIATGLRTIFTRIQRPRTIEFLRQFGVELVDLEGKFVGPFEASMRLGQALAGLEQGDITFIKIAEELGGFRQIGKVIPLLQQTRVAQEALNVAQGGANSLAADAAKAQQTLAVRLDQTQEKFIALIRSIADTNSFKLMASAALAIADSIVKVGEAIKPVLPLITALAAVKLVKGAGIFGGALAGRGVQGFAGGGMVPGTGNGDTVPAMLTPGEFVIRKQSVNKIGADRLASINRYASGGQVRVEDGTTGAFFLRPEQGVDRSIDLAKEPQGSIKVSNRSVLQKLGYKTTGSSNADLAMLNSIPSATGLATAIRGKAGGAASKYKKFLGGNINEDTELPKFGGGTIKARDALKDPEVRKRVAEQQGAASSGGREIDLVGSLSAFFPGKNDLENSAISKGITKRSQRSLKSAVKTGAMSVIKSLKNKTLSFNKQQVDEAALNLSTDSNALTTTSGFVYEGIIQALTGAKLQGKQANWDFLGNLSNFGSGLGGLFSAGADAFKRLIRADAKRTNSSKSRESIISKIESDINKNKSSGYSFIAKKAAGGGISGAGTDTVPALLTPGEFVVNKKSAQAIGYGTLGRMNKVGKYAKGGIVQRFEDGGGVEKMSNTRFSVEDVQKRASRIKASAVSRNLSKLGVAAFATTTALNGMLPAAQETDGALLRLARGLSEATTSTVGSIGALGFALQGLGDKFSIGNLIKGKFTGPLIAAGSSAMLVSTAFESIIDSTARFNKAIANNDVQTALELATSSSSSSARAAGAIGTGVVVGGLAAALAPVTGGLSLLATGLIAGGAAAGIFSYEAEKYADGFQDLLSNFGYATSAQVKAQAVAKINTQKFATALQKASERADEAFKRALENDNLGETSKEVFSELLNELKKTQADASTQNENIVKRQIENIPGLFNQMSPITGKPRRGLKEGETVEDLKLESGRLAIVIEQVSKELAKIPDGAGSGRRRSIISQRGGLAGAKARQKEIKSILETDRQIKKLTDEVATFIRENKDNKNLERDFNRQFQNRGLTFRGDGANESFAGVQALNDRQEAAIRDVLDKTKQFRQEAFRRDVLSNAPGSASVDPKNEKAVVDRLLKQIDRLPSNVMNEDMKLVLRSFAGSDPFKEVAIASNNIAREIERLRERFDLINLGLTSFNEATSGASLALKNYMKSVSGTASETEIAFDTLKAGIGPNASGVGLGEFSLSLDKVLDKVAEFGGSDDAVQRSRARLSSARAISTGMRDFLNQQDPNNLESLRSLSSIKGGQNRFADFMSERGVSDDALVKQAIEVFRNRTIDDPGAVAKFQSGELSIFQDEIGSITKSLVDELEPGIKKVIEIEKVEFEIRKKVNATLRDSQKAQQDAIKKQIDVATQLSKFGGKVVSISTRLDNLSKQTQISSGINATPTGINNRVAEIVQELEGINSGGPKTNTQFLREQTLNNELKLLATQSQALFKVRQDEFNIIKEKNALERSSQDALLSGDVGTLFRNFQTQTAINVGLGGDKRLAGQVESEAFLLALRELERRRDLGDDKVQGVEIREAIERVAFAAFSSMNRPNARVAAQRRAGTDAESVARAKVVQEAGETTVKVSQATARAAESLADATQNIEKTAKAIVSNIADTIGKTPIKILDADMEKFERLRETVQTLAVDGVKIKGDQNVQVNLMGQDLLQGLTQVNAQLITEKIADAFDRAKIDDNGKIILG